MIARASLPPGPRSGLLATFRYVRSPKSYLRTLERRFGDTFTIHGANGTVVMTTSPANAKCIFTAEPDTFEVFGQRATIGMLGSRGLLSTSGDTHKRNRKLLTPPFHGQRMRAYGEIMRDAARGRIADLRPGDRFRAHDVTARIAMDIILRAVFGVSRGPESAAAAEILHGLLEAIDPLLFFAGGLHTPLYPPYRRYRAALARYNTFVSARIAERRRKGAGEDILGMMIDARYEDGSEMDDETIRDQLLTLLLAGHETTAIALAWALRELALSKSARERARAEIATLATATPGVDPEPEALARLPFLGAVADETMRLHTIVTDVIRQLRAPLRVGKWDLPAGIAVSVASVAIHADATLYPDPETFRPERFLGKKPSPFEFLPFGGGHRRCIGAAFSDYEMRIVLATLLTELDLELESHREEKAVRRNITVGPAQGVPMRVVGRR
jgi:cytochrome P450 family 110